MAFVDSSTSHQSDFIVDLHYKGFYHVLERIIMTFSLKTVQVTEIQFFCVSDTFGLILGPLSKLTFGDIFLFQIKAGQNK